MGEPATQAERVQAFAKALEASDLVSFEFRPLSVTLRPNTAIPIYEATCLIRDRATGAEMTPVILWTDVAVRERGRWGWIADHGTMVGGGWEPRIAGATPGRSVPSG